MGTKVEIGSYMPGHRSMRDLGCESNGASWPPYYGDNNFPDGQCYGFLPRTTSDSHSGYDMDVVKQTILEHEAIFKNQVFELHRLYQVQRDLMDEVRRKEQIKRRVPHETSSSSSHVPSHMQHEDMRRWNSPTVPLANSVVDRSIPCSGTGTIQSSPPSIKGKSAQAGPSPFLNCCSPKKSEVSESRPIKCRRKMFDLQLPADEYLDPDEVEQFDKNRFVCEDRKPFFNYPGKKECQGDASICDSHVTKSRVLADLNEPLHMEETMVDSSVDFLGAAPRHSDVRYRGCPDKLFGSSKDVSQRSGHRSLNGVVSNTPFENGLNGRDSFCYASESEQHKGDVRSIDKGAPSTSSQLMRSLLDQLTQPPTFISCDRIKGDKCREKSDKSYLPSYNMPDPILSSHVPNRSSLFQPSDFSKTRDQCSSSRSKPSGFLSQKFPVLTSPSKSPQSSAQSNDFFGNKRNLNSAPGANAAYGGESSVRNVFPPVNMGPVKDMNLNVPYSNGVSYDETVDLEFKVVDHGNKSNDLLAVLPWLRGNGSKKSENGDCPSSRIILGVPIFEKPTTPKIEGETSWRKGGFDMNLPCEPSDSELDTVNVEVVAIEKRTQNESAIVRNRFDLNSCVTEEESPCGATTSLKRDTGIDLEAPVMVESDEDVHPEKIHLPNQGDNGEAELAKSAAETIVAISFSVDQNQSLTEASEEEMLRWFVDIACTSGNDPDNNGDWGRNHLPEGLDEYEAMILRSKECTVEEYFPKLSVPKFPNMDENGPCLLTTRTRKGHGRRGRQRRDFQRDILPGLTSLSRHEVTEDLQTFGEIMRLTGHPWHSAPNRRNAAKNGCGRGRPRSSKQISSSNTDMVLGDRCLTGWGKTTRRPRRQRCPPGNPPPPPLPLI